MHVTLPEHGGDDDVVLELRFARMPLEPCVLRVLSPASRTLAQFDLYGRGKGSGATQQLVLNLRLGRETIDREDLSAGDALRLAPETLDGRPLEPADIELELKGVTPRPAR